MKRLSRLLVAWITLGLLLGPGAKGETHKVSIERYTSAVPTSLDLKEGGADQRRWMSLPESRLVVNPHHFWNTDPPVKQTAGPHFPLNVGYYIGDAALSLPQLLSVYRGPLSQDRPSREVVQEYNTAWLPHELLFEGTYASGAKIEGSDFFYDPNTLVRSIQIAVEDSAAGRQFVVAGEYAGFVHWDPQHRLLTVETRTHSYVIGMPDLVGVEVAFYPSMDEFRRGDPPVAFPYRQGAWAVELAVPEAHGEVSLQFTVAFATGDEGVATAQERAQRPFTLGDVEMRRSEGAAFWDQLLQSVPHPHNFTLEWAPDLGVTADEIKGAYYKAWVFLAANVLPVLPEVGYPYPQLPTGKPSLWTEGAQGAKASATWESFFAIQLYAHVDAELAWRAFEGLMSLVDARGVLGGESLPSRKAQTASILYHLTGDTERLRAVYPALKRYLLWRRDNPRWIHGPHNFPYEKDAEFVVSALVDMEYAQQIAALIGEEDDVPFWAQVRSELFADYLTWFWPSPTAVPLQYYFLDTGSTSPGNDLWVATGLRLDMLTDPAYVDGLLRRFHRVFNPGDAFAGFGIPKYPDISFVVYGLLDRGYVEEARTFIDVSIRDVTRANMFAEQYKGLRHPEPDGVRPSVFGAALIIDMLWIKNGLRMDLGLPHIVRVSTEGGGLENLEYRGLSLHLYIPEDRQHIVAEGAYIQEQFGTERHVFELAMGRTEAIAPRT